MKEICTILEEHKETLADIDFKVSYEKENDKEQLCAILETVPITVWEALGFQQVRKVTVYDYLPYIGDFGLRIDIYMADKTHSIVSVSPQNPYFALASVYKPYHDFCTEKLRTMLAHLESHINYVETEDLTKKPEYRLRRVLHRDIGCKQYDVYFERWNLEDDLIRYCIQNEITFPDEILRKKRNLSSVFSVSNSIVHGK